ncbi:DUF2306 domain-containing protein [Marinagarivorans cellulosilyticus]|uniref:DUF2306 domain-containing protein n=1 Tax=Marinagarivorans cellulosilyticus TaxID=2721545 RepID=A0AAN1WE94_9GAMM|nr:DUF2306 domain-containing protein [Marinagarivorans cellulosilyticus]BCD95993.1 hypothetical protein MARGE09_P0192 [Marinagarivorans cellulosilyticus]
MTTIVGSPSATSRQWLTPFLLLMLGSVSVIFGALQLYSLGQGLPPAPTPDQALHYFAMPWPVVTHIVCGTIFNLIAPFQFAGIIRRRYPLWHRWAGRVLILCAFGAGASSLWMNHFYPAFGGTMKYLGILAHNIVLLGSLILSVKAILRRDIARHRAWMMRAVAAMLSPATQRLLIIPWVGITGILNDTIIAAVIWGGLAVNLVVVEWFLRHKQNA